MTFLNYLRSNVWYLIQYISFAVIIGSQLFLLYFYWARYSRPTDFELDTHKVVIPFDELCDLDSYMHKLEYEDHKSRLEFRPYWPLQPEKYGYKYNCLELSRFYSWAASKLDVTIEMCYHTSDGIHGHTWNMIGTIPIDWSAILSGYDMEDFDYEDYEIIE